MMLPERPLLVRVAPIGIILLLLLFQLRLQGRSWWCACGEPTPWAGQVWSSHASQHVFDPYSATHVLHGFLFCGILSWLFPKAGVYRLLIGAILLESGWEVLENSDLVIDRYRAATVSLDYHGDAMANSLGDIFCCSAGLLISHRLGWKRAVGVFLVTELLLLLWIKDSLLLNIIMLAMPLESVRNWQMAR